MIIILAASDTLQFLVGVVPIDPQIGCTLDSDTSSHHLEHEFFLWDVDNHGHETLDITTCAVNVLVRIIRD